MNHRRPAFSQTSHMNTIFTHGGPGPFYPKVFINQTDFSITGIFHCIHGICRKQSDQLGIQIFDSGSDDNAVRRDDHASVVIQIFCNFITQFRTSKKFSPLHQMQIVVSKDLAHNFCPHGKRELLVYCSICRKIYHPFFILFRGGFFDFCLLVS